MTFDLQKILESKREFRRGLCALPIEEKLRLLDVLRERQLTIRRASSVAVYPQMKTFYPQIHADEHRFNKAEMKPQTDAS